MLWKRPELYLVFIAFLCLSSTALAKMVSAHPPVGYVEYCQRNPFDCLPIGGLDRPLHTVDRWNQIVAVNETVNSLVKPVEDKDHYGVSEFWTYPYDLKGDCEDYVIAKRRHLLEKGWPTSAVLISIVRLLEQWHAVLLVRTTEGDFILDNHSNEILKPTKSTYRVYFRQSIVDPTFWVAEEN